jgi:cation transport ATPase
MTDLAARSPDRHEPDPGGSREESEEEARERYRELLEELRTIIPGVQVLFGFLLTAPFSARFGDLDGTGRDLYVSVLIGVTLAIVVFLTPAAFHRMSNERDRDRRLRLSIVCTVAGLTLLAASIVTAVFMVSRFVFDSTTASVVASVIGGAFAVCWYLLAVFGHDRTPGSTHHRAIAGSPSRQSRPSVHHSKE